MMNTHIETDGYEIIEDFLSKNNINKLITEIEEKNLAPIKGGFRNAEKVFPLIKGIASSRNVIEAARNYLSGEPKFVRAILFNKTSDNNWLVAWHQDKAVTLSEKCEMDGWGPWSIKSGVHHVQPPRAVLDNMITFRIHLDDTPKENGCLKVIKGSHNQGILATAEVVEIAKTSEQSYCEVSAGDCIAMRPLIIHASSKSLKPKNRRVIHLEYTGYDLPEGVNWV
ncbi:phytanoyl-CoA dioxygenase family protein [Pseudemcibacter aquimaris]|uniref:phytanoyl-CoA dioxygenase family protein n=1 Tax=Pseudemcibacter aquimaris TaxID=2857064 RepID=UPI0020113FC4|nr:phytanoyl-CoA dioxygenase family protein [Pseudemcibacter aquimaris]MCC3861653.1 phytanoyl-CoA dioxygenase family protein [Pseudemcibacter aquimaris]WDU58424.1 phytanoyl-CoA dioxygenase family protein [Pseudemcibacter aquimaris]